MSLVHLIDKVTPYWSWLYSRQWEPWEFAVAGLVVLVLLILLARARRKASARARLFQEGSTVIGLELAQSKPRHRRAESLLKWHLGPGAAKDARKVPPEYLKRQMAELRAANEQFRRELARGSQITDQFKKQADELAAANERLQQELAKSQQAEVALRDQVTQLMAAQAQSDQRRRKRRPAITPLRQTPLDERLRQRIQSIAPEKAQQHREQQPT